MPSLNDLPMRQQYAVLRSLLAEPKLPFVAFPSPVMAFPMITKTPIMATAMDNPAATTPVIKVDVRNDPRCRFNDAKAKVKTEPRHKRPWVQAHPAGPIGVVARLTTEGVRRLYALEDLITTDNDDKNKLN